MTDSIRRRIAAAGIAAGLTVFALAARGQDAKPEVPKGQGKTQSIETEGLRFDVPASWQAGRPTSSMRKAQVRIPAAEGDAEPAELVLFVFPGGAGGVEANVERWRRQFTDRDGDVPEVESSKVKAQDGREITRVEVAGTYTDPFAPGGPKDHYRLLGAIVLTDAAGYYFKLVGPDKTVRAAEADFDAMLKTIRMGTR
jgi:hypothetical protein